MTTFRHSGKMGDLIYSLPLIRHLGGGHLKINPGIIDDGSPRLTDSAFQSLLPLLEIQSYIKSVTLYEGGQIDVDLDKFREAIPWSHANLVDANYIAHDLAPDPKNHIDPWIEIPGVKLRTRKPVVVSRTERYLGGQGDDNLFYHQMVRQGLGDHGIFIGFPHEHARFEELFSVKIEHIQPDNSLEIAMILGGSELWIGNENYIGALAEGLKKTCAREIRKTEAAEKMYCAFQRPNLFYV
jgi:hypothetical protein